MDAVISPVAPHAAIIPGKWCHYSKHRLTEIWRTSAECNSEYGGIANVLDYTTVVIPITKACKEVDVSDSGYQPLNPIDRRNWLACRCAKWDPFQSAYLCTDDPNKYDGAPAALQIIGRRFDEEKLLSIALLVMDALEG